MSTPLRVLIVEDSEDDALLLERQLRQGGYEPSCLRVDTAESMKRALDGQAWDIVFSDLEMPSFTVSEALTLVRQARLDVPFIVVSGAIDEATAKGVMREGAHDYLVKGDLRRLLPTIERELREAQERTSRRSTEDALLESEERYFRLAAVYSRLAAIVESSDDAIIGMTLDGIVTSWNRGARHIYGYRAEGAVGQSASLLFPSSRTDEFEQLMNRIKNGEHIDHYETQLLRKDGHIIDVSVSAFPVRDPEDRIIGASTIARDITERRRAEAERAQLMAQEQEARARAEAAEALHASEEEVRRLNAELELRVIERTAQLEAANKELEAFAYSVSHDLRAPLRSIDGFSRALMEDFGASLAPDARDYLQRVRRASRHMGDLIDSMLELSRVSRAELRRLPIDLTALAYAIADELQKSEPERVAELTLADGLIAEGDVFLLRVALDNLMSNAWKFTRNEKVACIELGVTQLDGTPTYFIRDNGAGFDMRYAPKLFGAFQRLHAAAEFEGTGVGLATVKRIVHRHGGRIWAEGQVGLGATFYFTLCPPL